MVLNHECQLAARGASIDPPGCILGAAATFVNCVYIFYISQ